MQAQDIQTWKNAQWDVVGKILVVDDEIALKDALVDALVKQSYEARGYTSGHEALEALRREDFDLLISDLMMPEMDGIALINAALEIDPHLVSIIMTGPCTNETAEEAKKVGAFDYVLKPFRLKALMPTLKRAMNRRRLVEKSLSKLDNGDSETGRRGFEYRQGER